MVEAAEAAKEFELCLARSLGLCHTAGNTIAHDVLDVDTAVSSSASFKQKSTIGVMLSGTTVDNIVVGGPAYGKMAKGDTIKQVDGQKAKSDNIATLLYGSDVPGSEVKIEFLSSKGQAKKITLRRMKVEAIADKHQMFHLFTEVKKAASKHSDASMGALVDKSIDHWTKMLIADAEHDQKICDNVETMQRFAQDTLATLTSELESMAGFSQTCFTYSNLLGDQKVSRWGDTLKLIRKEIKSNKSADSVSAKAKVSQHAQETEAAQKALEDANRQVEALWDERDTLRSALDDANRLNAELQAELAELMGGREQHEQDMLLTANALEEKAVAAFAAKLAAERDLAALREDMAAMKDKHRASAADTAELTSLVERLRRQCAHMQEDQSKLEAERDEAVAKQQSTVLRVMSLEKALADAEAALQQLRENTNRELASRQMRIADLEAELARLSAALKQQEREVEALHDSMARLRDERNAARGAAQRDGERLVAKTTEVQRIEQTLDQQRRDLSQRQARIDELEEALLRAQQLGDKTVADFAQARSAWAASQLAHEERARTLHERLHAVIKAAQAMYVAISQPSAGAVTGLGLILQPRDSGTAAGAQVGDVLAGSVAAVDGRIVAGDMVVAVNGVSVEGRTAQEIEILMCGPIWTKIVTAVQKAGGSHEKIQVELMRGFGEDETSCVQAVVGYMQQEAVSTARRTLEELELIKLQLSSEVDLHKADNQQFLQDKERLQTEVDQAQHREQRAEQLRRETAEAFSAYKQQCVLQQQRSTVSVENLSQIARAFVGEASACMRGIDDDTSIMQASLSRLSGEVQRLESEHAGLSKSHTDALERLDRSKVDLEGLQKQNILLSTSLDAAQVKVAEHERESRDLAAKLLRAGRERDTLQNNLGAVMPQLQDAQAAVGKLEGLVETHEREGEALAAKVHCLEVQVQELSLQLRNVMSANSALEIDGKAAQVKIGRMEAEAQRVESAAAEERVRTAGIEAELASLHDSMRVKRTEAHQREYEMAAAQAEARRLQALSEATQRAAEDAKSALLVADASKRKLLEIANQLATGTHTLYRAVCHKIRQPDDTMAAELSMEPLQVAIESLLARIPEACDASAMLHSEVQALSESLKEEREAHKQEGNAQSEQLDRLRSEVEDLKHKLVAAEALSRQIGQDLEAREQRHREECISLHKQMSEARDIKVHTEQELDKAQETTSNLRLEVAKFKSMLQDAEKSIASLTQEADNAKKDKYEAEEGLTKQHIQVDNAVAKLDAAQVRISSLEKSLSASEAEQQRAQEKWSDLLAEHDKLKAQLAAQKVETSERVKEVEDAHEKLVRVRQARDAASRQADHESERVLRIQMDVKAANERVEEKKKALTEMQNRSAIMQQQALEQQAQTHEALRNSHAQIDAAQVRLTALQHQLTVATEALQHSKSELAETHRRHSGLESTVAKVNGALAQRSNELQLAQAMISRLNDEKSLAMKDAEAERERARAKENEVLSAERLVDELRHEATKVQERLGTLEMSVTRAETERKTSEINLVDAQREWDALERQYQVQIETLQRRLVETVKAGQSMYVSVCQPSAGVASGLGLMLASRPGHASGAVVAEIIAGSAAAGSSSQMAVGDLIVEVAGVSAVKLSVEEVESILCGPMGEAVQIRAQRNGAVYEVILARGCGHDESAVSDLVGHMQADTCSTAARMRSDMESLREKHRSELALHTQDSQTWLKEKETLSSELAQARQNEKIAIQQRTDARALMHQHEENFETRKQAYSINLEKVSSLVRVFIADMYGRIAEIEQDRQRVLECQNLLRQKLSALVGVHTQLSADHAEALESLGTWEIEKSKLERQNKILATELDRAQVKVAEHERESRDLAAKLLRAGRERDTLQNNLGAVMPQLQDAQAAVGKLEGLVETHEREGEALAAKVHCLEVQVQELSLQLRNVMSANSALEIDGKAAQVKIGRMEAEAQRVESAAAEERVRTAGIEAELASLHDSMRVKRTEAHQREYEMAAAQAEARRLQALSEATQRAAEDAKSALLLATHTRDKRTTQLRAALRCAETMYGCACKPVVGVVTGLGLVLEATSDADGSNRVAVAEVLAQSAAFDSQQIAPKDTILEIDSSVVTGMELQEVEKCLSGLVFSPVKIKLNRFVGGTYVVELERRNGQDDVDSALDRLEQHLREDTCKAVNLMHYDLDSIKTQLLKSFSKYEKENKEWTQDKDALMSEITALKLQLAAADKHQQALAEDMRQQQEQHSKDRSDLSLKHADARRAATEAQKELDALLSTHCQLKSEMQKSHSAQQESEIAATRAQKEAEELRSEAKAAFATAEQLKAQLTSAAAKLDEAQARILKLETAAAAADASTASVKQELADANADKDKMTTEIVNHKKSSSMVQRELEEALAVAARLRAEKEALQTRLIDEATRIKALEEELAGAEKQLGEKRREAQTMMDDYHSLEQDLGAKTSEEAEARSKLQEATRVWDTARLSYQEYSDSMRARMAEAAKVAQAMYVAICRPSVSAATGLGLVLASAEGGRNPVIQELVEGGTALACGKMNKGDTVLAVNGIATQDVSLEDVEISLCGAVGTTVTIRAVTVGSKKAYEVALVRNAGAPDEAAIASLVSTLLPEAVGVAARMHEELEDLRARAKADADQHEETSLRWQTETEQLRADLADAHRRLELASKDAEEALRDKQDLDTQIRQQRDDMQRKIDEAKAATADALTQLDAQERATMVGKTKLVNLKGATEEAEKAARTAAKQALDANTALEAAQEACRKESEKAAMAAAKLDALSVRVMGLESALAEGEGALQRLTNDCADKDATIQKLQSEASALKQQVDKQEHELEAAQERGTRLREEKNEAVKQVKQEQKRVSAREAELEVSADKLAKSVKECKEFQDRIVTLQDGLREELGKHQETARELDAARAQEEILTERCSSQESDLKKVLSAYQELQKIICTPLVGGLYGVGITVKQHEETGKSIGAIAAGMSAAVSGKLEVDDVILQVDATPVQDMPVDKVQALMVGALGTNVKIKVSSAGSAKTVTDTLTRGSCATTTADGLVSRAPEARKALEDFLKEHADLRKALKNAEAAATAGANDAKKASAERIQQLEADMVKLHKREAESDKALAQLRDAKRALESERDTLKQELADLHKTAAGAVKLQEALKSLKQQLSDATAKLKRDAEELTTQKKQLQHDADEIAVLKKAAAVSADAHKKELQKLSAGPCNRCKGKDPGSMLPPLAPSTKPPPSPRVTAPSPRGKENQETPRAPLSARGAPKLVGVGVRLTDNSPHCVAEFVRDGPAHRCGKIQAGDHLLEVDGEDIQTLPIAQIAAKIVGPEGSELRLKFARGNGADATVFDVSLTRGSSSGHS